MTCADLFPIKKNNKQTNKIQTKNSKNKNKNKTQIKTRIIIKMNDRIFMESTANTSIIFEIKLFLFLLEAQVKGTQLKNNIKIVIFHIVINNQNVGPRFYSGYCYSIVSLILQYFVDNCCYYVNIRSYVLQFTSVFIVAGCPYMHAEYIATDIAGLTTGLQGPLYTA